MEPLAFDLARGLLAHTLTCEQVGTALSRQANSLVGPDELVHFLAHFVADQDIHGRDPAYANWQEAELRKMVQSADRSST